MDTELITDWVSSVWGTRPGCRMRSLRVLDSFRAHSADEVRKSTKQNKYRSSHDNRRACILAHGSNSMSPSIILSRQRCGNISVSGWLTVNIYTYPTGRLCDVSLMMYFLFRNSRNSSQNSSQTLESRYFSFGNLQEFLKWPPKVGFFDSSLFFSCFYMVMS